MITLERPDNDAAAADDAPADDVPADANPTHPRRRIGRLLSGLLLTLAAVGSAGLAFAVTVGHIHFARILTESMAPDINRGDVLVLRKVATVDLHPGQIVLLPMPSGGGTLYAHRLVTVTKHDGTVTVTTKGDANATVDPWSLNIDSASAPVVIARLPLSDVPIVGNARSLVKYGLGLVVFLLVGPRIWAAVRRRERRAD